MSLVIRQYNIRPFNRASLKLETMALICFNVRPSVLEVYVKSGVSYWVQNHDINLEYGEEIETSRPLDRESLDVPTIPGLKPTKIKIRKIVSFLTRKCYWL